MNLANLIILYALIAVEAVAFTYFAIWYYLTLKSHAEHLAWVSEEASKAGVVDLPGEVGKDLHQLKLDLAQLRDEFEKHVVLYTNWRRSITKMAKTGDLGENRDPLPTNNKDVVAELRKQIGLKRIGATNLSTNSTNEE